MAGRSSRYAVPAKRRMGEPTLPLINVVFLLLIFVLLTSVIEPEPPIPVDLAESSTGGQAEGTAALLYVSGDGLADETAIMTIEELRGWVERSEPQLVAIRADRSMTAARLFGFVDALEELGVAQIELVVLGR